MRSVPSTGAGGGARDRDRADRADRARVPGPARRSPARPAAPVRLAPSAALFLWAILIAVVSTANPTGAAPEGPPTGGCRTVGGGAVASAGPHRATVIIDTGSGEVVSACISFEGTITALAAIELAAAQVGDLSPVYETYAGQGRGICQLRGVGNRPPNCLSKSVEYWAYHHNGVYSRVGASTSTVADGDVEAWSWGRGTPARPATRGTETVAAAPEPPPTPAPAPAGTQPHRAPEAAPDRNDRSVEEPTTPPPAADIADGESGDVDPEPTSPDRPDLPVDAEAPDEADGALIDPGRLDQPTGPAGIDPSGGGPDQVAAPAGTAAVGGGEGDGTGIGSMIGFGIALAAVGVVGVMVRRRSPRTGSA